MKKHTHFIFLILLLLLPLGVLAQHETIKGQVIDEKGETIIGATVMVKGSANGTITDLDGNFSVKGKIGNTLSITFVGYTPLEVKVTKLVGNQYVLKEDSKVLDEVVVVGMDKQKRNTITASVSTVGEAAIASRPITDVTSVLQGNVAGLNFATDASLNGVGGETGASIKFNIRGAGSINGDGGAPYVLVDGIEQSLQNVNPTDIASISVLKDASASAVYGARAAYGVVLVTTKSGSKNKAIVSYNGTVGFSSPINMPQMMNSIEFAGFVNDRCDNMNVKRLFSFETIDKMGQFMENPYSADLPGLGLTTDGTDWAGAYESQYANTDWFKYYFKDKAIRHSHNLNINGGTDKMNYYIGMGYTYQDGLMDNVEDNLSKYNLNAKFEIRVNKWLRFNFNNNMTLNMLKRPMADQTIFYSTLGGSFPNRPTHLPVESQYNLPNWNERLYYGNSNYQQNKISDALTLSTTITPLEGWDIMGEMRVRLDIENNDFKLRKPTYEKPGNVLYVVTGNKQGYQYPGMHWKNTQFGSYTRGNLFNYYLSPSISTAYRKEIGEHSLKGLVGYQMEVREDSNGFMYKDGMMSEDTYSFDNANGMLYAGEARTHWATLGMYAKLNWAYKDMYFAEFSGRYDGSSRFAPGNRFGFFPSFSVGYDMARADYFKTWSLPVSQLKVRFSYGRLGNQNGAGLYDYMGIMALNGSDPNAWLLPGSGGMVGKGTIAGTPKMISPFITWEKVDNANLGLDMMLFDNRLSINADVYQRTTRDMIGPAEAIPAIGGIVIEDRSKVNNATLRNRGWELSINWSDRFKNGVSYGIGLNVSDYKAVVTEYNNPEQFLYNNHTGLPRNKGYFAGMDLGDIWGFQADDLFMSNREIDDYLKQVDLSFFKPSINWQRGDLKYLDVNGDGKVDPGKGTLSDHGDLKVIGNTTPRYSFGVNLNVGYKGFEVSTLLQGVAKRDFPMAGSTYLFGGQNYFKDHLNYFSPNNPNAYLPRLTEFNKADYQANSGYNNTRYMLDASYMRMKNLMLSYNFNKKLITSMGLSRLRVYFTCDNLFTLSHLPQQFDPETLNQVSGWAGGSNASAPGLTSPANANGNGKVYPLNRNFVFGVDFTF